MTPILCYDTETTGVVDPIHLVELGAVLIDEAGTERASVSLIVRPDGWTIPEAAARVHGITNDVALRLGVPLVVAIAALTNLWAVATVRVAHNLEYDDRVVDAALTRLGRPSQVRRPPGVCTKELAAPVLNLPPTERMIAAGYGNKPKSPSLKECVKHFFDEDQVIGAHGALADARACARVYLALKAGGNL